MWLFRAALSRCDGAVTKTCADVAFGGSGSGDPCAIEEANRKCLHAHGCSSNSLPPKLCSGKLLASESDHGRDLVLEWLADRAPPAGMVTMTMQLAGAETSFGVGLSQDAESHGPVLVTLVGGGSAAERAGVRPGDEVLRLGGMLRTEETGLTEDVLPLLKQAAACEGRNLTVTMFREPLAEHESPSLCEFFPCFDTKTPCFGSRDSYVCSCPTGTSGRACRPEGTAVAVSRVATNPLRVALVLSGQPRFVGSSGSDSVVRQVLDRYGADTFFHVWWSRDAVGTPYSVAPWTGLRAQPGVITVEHDVIER